MPPVAPSAQASPQDPQQSDTGEIVEMCIKQTWEALMSTGLGDQDEVVRAVEIARESHAQGRPLDLMEALARHQGHQEEHLGKIIQAYGDKLAGTLKPSPPLIPFAGKLIAPSAFYESFERLHRIARALLAPVIFVEDTDSIGVASANPIAAFIMAGKIQEVVARRFDIRPFLTVARIDYESWTFLTHKHFEL